MRLPPGGSATALFAAASLANALLLFLVQPMTAKALLPLFGGTAAVWTACMLFYQAALLVGYAYAHALRRLTPRAEAAVHLALLAAAAASLPPGLREGWAPEPGAGAPALLAALARAAGLPFLALAAGAPVLQRWYARAGAGRSEDPYFLYAASNLGSFGALLAYPFVVEPLWDLRTQGRLWSGAYAGVLALWCVCAWRTRAGRPAAAQAPGASGWVEGLRWAALAAVPSSLMLGVTTTITTDIAPVPLLWVAPLALYLATYVWAFSGRGPALTRWCAAVAPLAAMAWAFAGLFDLTTRPALLLHLGLLAVLAGALHGRLSGSRPPASRLSEYYLWAAAGGAAGGLFNGFLAPLAFSGIHEYGAAVAAALLLLPDSAMPARPPGEDPQPRWWRPSLVCAAAAALLCWLGDRLPWRGGFLDVLGAVYKVLVPAALAYHLARSPRAFRAALAAVVAVLALRSAAADRGAVVVRERDFYGVLTVKRDPAGRWMTLTHGNTIHGRQSLDPSRRGEPLTYFHRAGPAGAVFAALRSAQRGRPARVAVVGLGAGTLAAYALAGDELVFYELDPAVERMARAHFTFLADAEGRGASVRVAPGDARLTLAQEDGPRYDLLVVDAFSSDSIPVHLVTREALELYRSRLAPGGLLAFHVTNRHLRLARAFARQADAAGLAAARRRDGEPSADGALPSEWVVLSADPARLAPLAADGDWLGMRPTPRDPLWTDSYSSLLPLLR
ncbi:MAG: fused MFS/spermidine synthase [Elusimicrobia bacterium]|nr:fused MFS/spermidine synthase [Elusimicrobiota bacterium]